MKIANQRRRKVLWVLLLAVSVLAGWSTGHAADRIERDTLPIYRLGAPKVDAEMVRNLAAKTLSIRGEVTTKDDKERLTLRSGDQVVEVYRASGGIWLANEAQLWNPELKPRLPDAKKARAIAEEYFKQARFLPRADAKQPFSVSFKNQSGTRVATFDAATGRRTDRQLDVQVNYAVQMRIPGPPGAAPLTLPVVGGGGEFNLTLGDQGKVIASSGVWRPVEKIEQNSRVIPQAEADRQFKELVKGVKIRSFSSYLAYYSAPAPKAQRFLYPVYVYRAIAVSDDAAAPLRLIMLPATEFGPKLPKPKPLPERTPRDRPRRGSLIPDDEQPRPESKQPREGPVRAPGLLLPGGREAGTSWMGTIKGLSGSQKNAGGFVDALKADGWEINFNWGNQAAWESDWVRNEEDWVDAADFVFYTGHAGPEKWQLHPPDDHWVHYTETGSVSGAPSARWGDQDLEWIIIAACGPLQDDILASGGGDVFKRWGRAFQGLHQLLGYAEVTLDNEEEGKTVVKYCREGRTIISAWFRTAKEIQPTQAWPGGPTIYVGVVYAYRSGTKSPYGDHIWGHGSVAPDPHKPNVYVAIWSPT